MNQQTKSSFLFVGIVIVAVGSIAYGALTAPGKQDESKNNQTVQNSAKPTNEELVQKLESEKSTIRSVLLAQYPSVGTNYIVTREQLFDKGQWYGALLTYRGTDKLNRDTLRVLMQKKDGVWTLRTTPPVLLLSTQKFADTPRWILQSINKPTDLP